jgi:hypothetical protein
MGVRMNVIKLLAVSGLFATLACAACGGTKSSGEAKGPESNPWADYKGTYATAGSGSSASSAGTSKKSAKTEVAAAEAPKSEEPAAAPADETPAAPATPPPAKKGKTAGKGAKKKK